jgi:hypothetical protein
MAADADQGDAPGYAWPGADEEAVSAGCARVARHLALAGVRTIGVLPVFGTPARRPRPGQLDPSEAVDLRPLLERLAGSLAAFGGGTVAFFARWKDWGAEDRSGGADRTMRMRMPRPHVAEMLPPRCQNGPAAAFALRHALAALPPVVQRVLVDIGGYVPASRVPPVVDLCDGVLLAVGTARVRRRWLAPLLDQLPAAKRLGAILIG